SSRPTGTTSAGPVAATSTSGQERPATSPTSQVAACIAACRSDRVSRNDAAAFASAVTPIPTSTSLRGPPPATAYTVAAAAAAPVSAPATTAAGPAPTTTIITTAPADAPAPTPITSGLTSGLRAMRCSSAPASPSAAPTSSPTRARGSRLRTTMSYVSGVPRPASASSTAGSGTGYSPTVTAQSATA